NTRTLLPCRSRPLALVRADSGGRPCGQPVALTEPGPLLLDRELQVRPDRPCELDCHLAEGADGGIGSTPVGLQRFWLRSELGADDSLEVDDEALRLVEKGVDGLPALDRGVVACPEARRGELTQSADRAPVGRHRAVRWRADQHVVRR